MKRVCKVKRKCVLIISLYSRQRSTGRSKDFGFLRWTIHIAVSNPSQLIGVMLWGSALCEETQGGPALFKKLIKEGLRLVILLRL